jgi:predicted permease
MNQKSFFGGGFIDSRDAKAKEARAGSWLIIFVFNFNMLMTGVGGYMLGTWGESETFVRNFWRIEARGCAWARL